MSRRLFTVASVLSLPLFVATVVLWVRSYSHLEGVAWETRRAGKLITFAAWSSEGSWYGQRNVFHVWPGVRPPEPKGWTWQNYEGDEEKEAAPDQREFFYSGISHRWLGFALGTSGSEDDVATTGVAAPYWAAAGCFAIFPIALSLRIAVAYRRRKHQMCLQCGYDLRATPDRCPECGVKKGAKKFRRVFKLTHYPVSRLVKSFTCSCPPGVPW